MVVFVFSHSYLLILESKNKMPWMFDLQIKNLLACPSPEHVEYLLHSKDELEKDLEAAKDLLMIERNRWGFDCN